MPSLAYHCQRSLDLLGEAFEEVHRWLDEFHGQPPHGSRHRYLRHTQTGLADVRSLWGDKAAQAAELHIRDDLADEGWPEDRPIPITTEDYRKTGLW